MRTACTLIVIAKAPRPGRSKTRLTPPCSPAQAAALARGALTDTLATVAATPAARRVCVLEGEPGDWLPHGVDTLPQRGDGLDERLAAAFEDVGGPALLVGMDTPQLTPRGLLTAMDRLFEDGTDAVLGMAEDGGWWGIGLRRPVRELFVGVPMSTEETGVAQLRRLHANGLRVEPLPTLRDVDLIDDARAVAALCPPQAAFPTAFARVEAAIVTGVGRAARA